MAIYRLSTSYVGRSHGRSAVQAAAYRARTCLYDDRTGKTHDYRRAGVETGKFIASGILLPENAPTWLTDETLSEQQRRAVLWNAVETKETRKDAVLARDMLISLPRELSYDENIELVTTFLRDYCTARGMVADWAFHEEPAGDGGLNPHAHVMLTVRPFDLDTADGWGKKAHRGLPKSADQPVPSGPDWNSRAQLMTWREEWAVYANRTLATRGHDIRIDHRSYEEQGIDAEPGFPIGKTAAALEREGEETSAAERLAEIKRENAERIEQDPAIVIAKVARQRATFTQTDVARALHELIAPYGKSFGRTDGDDDGGAFNAMLSRVMSEPALTSLGKDHNGVERFATRQQIVMEEAIERMAYDLNGRETHAVSWPLPSGHLSAEQKHAAQHILDAGDIACLIGKAGSGKTTTLSAISRTFEAEGYSVRGAALSGIAAQNLSDGAGIESQTVAALRALWRKGEHKLKENDVLIVDEAGMLGTRDMYALLDAAHQANAKIILVGDAQQLQAIEAGAAFKALADQLGARELTAVHRQQERWQAAATADLARGDVAPALRAYDANGAVRGADTRDEALSMLVDDWAADRKAGQGQLILAHKRADVHDLNERAREAMKQRGLLGEEREFIVLEQAEEAGRIVDRKKRRSLAAGDRVIFLRNDKRLEVKNGTVGTLRAIDKDGAYDVRLDDGRVVQSDLHAYGYIDHGYATTVHKAQGVTVDKTYVLASSGFDQHITYVALTRHRESAQLYWDRGSFRHEQALEARLGRENSKDNALDYRDRAAAKRGFELKPEPLANAEPIQAPATLQVHPQQQKPTQEHKSPARWKAPALEYRPPGYPKPLSIKPAPEPRPVRPKELPKPILLPDKKPSEIRLPTPSPLAAAKARAATEAAKKRRDADVPAAPALSSAESGRGALSALSYKQKAALKALDGAQRRALSRKLDKGHGRERGRGLE